MDATKLLEDEVLYELSVRGLSISGGIFTMWKRLSDAYVNNTPILPEALNNLDYKSELTVCQRKYWMLSYDLQETSFDSKQFVCLNTRLNHLRGRIQNIRNNNLREIESLFLLVEVATNELCLKIPSLCDLGKSNTPQVTESEPCLNYKAEYGVDSGPITSDLESYENEESMSMDKCTCLLSPPSDRMIKVEHSDDVSDIFPDISSRAKEVIDFSVESKSGSEESIGTQAVGDGNVKSNSVDDYGECFVTDDSNAFKTWAIENDISKKEIYSEKGTIRAEPSHGSEIYLGLEHRLVCVGRKEVHLLLKFVKMPALIANSFRSRDILKFEIEGHKPLGCEAIEDRKPG